MSDAISWLSKAKDILSLNTKQIFAVAFITWGIAVIPQRFFDAYGLSAIREISLPYITGLALISSLWLISLYIFSLVGRVMYKFKTIKHLKELSPIEQAYLLNYVNNDKSTYRFRLDDGVARGLTYKHILYIASELSYRDTEFDFNIKPWVLKHLKSHKELLAQGNTEAAQKQSDDQLRPPWVW